MNYIIDYINHFEDYLFENEKSSQTIESYKRDVYEFLDFLKDKDLKDLSKTDVIAYKKYLREKEYIHKGQKKKGLSPSTVNRKLVSINQFKDFLNEYFNFNLNYKVKQVKTQKQQFLKQSQIFSLSDYKRICRAAMKKNDIRALAIFETLAGTGMRVSELLQMTVKDVGRKNIKVTGKGDKTREVLIPKQARETLKKYLEVRENTDPEVLFTGQRGPINRQTVHNMIKYYAGQAKIKKDKAHAHSFRHMFGTLTVKEKGIYTTAKLLGHENINTTAIYVDQSENELLDTLDDIFTINFND